MTLNDVEGSHPGVPNPPMVAKIHCDTEENMWWLRLGCGPDSTRGSVCTRFGVYAVRCVRGSGGWVGGWRQ